MKEKIIAILIAAAVGAFCARPANAAKKNAFVFGIHFMSGGGGVGSAQMFDMANTLLNYTQKEVGDTWKLEKFSTEEEVNNAFLKGKLDAIMTYPSIAVELADRGAVFHPWATYKPTGRNKRALCLWHAKTENYSKARSFEGKNLMLDVFWPLWVLSLRDYLSSEGLDMPLWEIFNSITFSPNQSSAYISVAMGKADFFWNSDDADIILKMTNPEALKKLAHTACTDRVYARPSVILNGKTMKAADIKRYRDALGRFVQNNDALSRTNPDIKRVTQMLKILKTKLTVAGEDEFSREFELLKKAKKNGWMEEAKIIEAQTKNLKPGVPVKVKPPYGFCKKRCAKDKDKVKCAEKCMN